MAIRMMKTKVQLSEICTVEDAESLLAWLIANPKADIDLLGVDHLHSAVLQAIAAVPNPISKLPKDPFWRISIEQLRADQPRR